MPLVNSKMAEHLVVHGTVRIKRPRPKLKKIGLAFAMAQRFRSAPLS